MEIAIVREMSVYPLAREHTIHFSGRIKRPVYPRWRGNTHRHRCGWPSPAVYPRWRGEHTPGTVASPCATGLSPLARGTRRYHCVIGADRRFIPAGAGNTQAAISTPGNRAVYPAGAGTHGGENSGKRHCGLSPLAREHAHAAFLFCYCIGLSRWRGEHRFHRYASSNLCGLSRWRGNTILFATSPAMPTVYPAGAGNTGHG